MLTPNNQASPRFILFLATLAIGITYNSATCHVDDMAGLMAFKGGLTAGQTGLLESWKSGTDCCKWDHILCNSKNRVDTINLEDPVYHIRKPTYLIAALVLEGNLFSGPIPSSVSKLTKLHTLRLSHNSFAGTIPKEIGKLKILITLELAGSQFTGIIPEMFSSLPSLLVINLSHNKLSGKIPSTLSLVPNLFEVYLGHNALTGKIPSFSRDLYNLDLSSNRLSGTVPETFTNLTGIANLNLSRNLLVDPFPQLKGMQSLDLSYNNFQLGDVPKWATAKWGFAFDSLKLAKCGIKIKLDDWKPSDSYFFPSILNIDLSDNEISGSLVNLLTQTGQLKEFLISNNKIRFNMESLKFHSSLESLDISRNLVFGKLPKTISGLKNLNVSYNHLCGAIPPTNFTSTSFVGNDCLCGSPLYPCKK